jgi:hypothetical protein
MVLAGVGGCLASMPATAGALPAVAARSAATKTFSFIAAPGAATKTIVDTGTLLLNARCTSAGAPVVYAFSSADGADLLGRVFDGLGNGITIRSSAFDRTSRGMLLTPRRNDFHVFGTVLYETPGGTVAQVTYAADNATTLGKRRVCTVFGSYLAG